MLKTRIIPVLLVRDGKLVKGEKFDGQRVVGHPLQAARIHEMRGVDELIILDIGATPNNTPINTQLIEEITKDCFMPITVGGGVRTLGDVGRLLRAGADKVCIGNYGTMGFIKRAARKYGSQCIVAAINVSGGLAHGRGKSASSWMSPEFRASLITHYLYEINANGHGEPCGAGEILLNHIDRDGTMQGYDLDLIYSVSNAVNIPVVVAGGASSPEDCAAAIDAGASAVAVGALFQFTDTTPAMVAQHFAENNIPVRV